MTRILSPLVLSLTVFAAGCANRPEKEEREDWGPAQWSEARRENAERLKSEDQRAGARVIGVCDKAIDTLWDQVQRIYYWISGDSPFNAAKSLFDPNRPDKRRQAIMYLSRRKFGREDPYLKYYAEMARTDPDYTVRAMAIRALNRGRDRRVTSLYMQALEDKSDLVRLEAAKALANIPEPLAAAALMKHLENQDETTDVRVACADALRNYPTLDAAQVLVRALRDRNFAVSWQARKSLKLMTGRDYRYDQAAWLTYLSESPKPFG